MKSEGFGPPTEEIDAHVDAEPWAAKDREWGRASRDAPEMATIPHMEMGNADEEM